MAIEARTSLPGRLSHLLEECLRIRPSVYDVCKSYGIDDRDADTVFVIVGPNFDSMVPGGIKNFRGTSTTRKNVGTLVHNHIT